jgi:hypothetical protein
MIAALVVTYSTFLVMGEFFLPVLPKACSVFTLEPAFATILFISYHIISLFCIKALLLDASEDF